MDVVPIHKKDEKQYLKNYRPISLLLIYGKIFEKLIFNEMLKFFIENEISVFQCHNPQGIKFLTRHLLDLSHLREHKSKHSFQDSLNPLCRCGAEVQSTTHILLHCPIYIMIGSPSLALLETLIANY